MLTIYLVVGMGIIIMGLKMMDLEDAKNIFEEADTIGLNIFLYTVFAIGTIGALAVWPLLVLYGFIKGMTE